MFSYLYSPPTAQRLYLLKLMTADGQNVCQRSISRLSVRPPVALIARYKFGKLSGTIAQRSASRSALPARL